MIFELRHYVPTEGKREQLRERFANGTLALFAELNFKVIEFWEAPHTGDFWYLVEWTDEDTMKTAWEAFRKHKGWLELKARTETDGPLASITSVVLTRPAYFDERSYLSGA